MFSECWKRGATILYGVDIEKDYIDCARDLSRYNKIPISFLDRDLNYVELKFDRKIDIVFALSLYKHIGNRLFDVLKSFEWKTCYIESNNSPEHRESEQARKIEEQIKKAGWKYEYIGITEDRSPRALWKIER
jgi:hypothetical protein